MRRRAAVSLVAVLSRAARIGMNTYAGHREMIRLPPSDQIIHLRRIVQVGAHLPQFRIAWSSGAWGRENLPCRPPDVTFGAMTSTKPNLTGPRFASTVN